MFRLFVVLCCFLTVQCQLEEAHPAPEPYAFAFSSPNEDGTSSSREESGDASGRIVGSYTLLGADGQNRRVEYVADADGFRANVITNEIGTESQNPADAQYLSSAPTAAELTAAFEASGAGRVRLAGPGPLRGPVAALRGPVGPVGPIGPVAAGLLPAPVAPVAAGIVGARLRPAGIVAPLGGPLRAPLGAPLGAAITNIQALRIGQRVAPIGVAAPLPVPVAAPIGVVGGPLLAGGLSRVEAVGPVGAVGVGGLGIRGVGLAPLGVGAVGGYGVNGLGVAGLRGVGVAPLGVGAVGGYGVNGLGVAGLRGVGVAPIGSLGINSLGLNVAPVGGLGVAGIRGVGVGVAPIGVGIQRYETIRNVAPIGGIAGIRGVAGVQGLGVLPEQGLIATETLANEGYGKKSK